MKSDNSIPYTHWTLGPFSKHTEPVLRPDKSLEFLCPVLKQHVPWANAAIFNPAAVVVDGRVCVIFRAECHLGSYNDGCRIGLAWSDDGHKFKADPEPVLFRDHDSMADYEWPMGCEDPRVTRREDGLWVMTYTAFDTHTARLCISSSRDLRHWTKHGLAFRDYRKGYYNHLCCKSGSIVSKRVGDQIIATRINGKYWMYFGEGVLFAATSDDLLSWEPLEFDTIQQRVMFVDENRIWKRQEWVHGPDALRPVVFPRQGRFDQVLCEPGPPALLTEKGIVLLYNAFCPPSAGGSGYSPGQILFDAADPAAVIGRTEHPFMVPELAAEKEGVTGNVCFVEGLVPFRDRWMLYYGGADSVIFVATAVLS